MTCAESRVTTSEDNRSDLRDSLGEELAEIKDNAEVIGFRPISSKRESSGGHAACLGGEGLVTVCSKTSGNDIVGNCGRWELPLWNEEAGQPQLVLMGVMSAPLLCDGATPACSTISKSRT